MKTIVVAVDGSARAREAAEFGIDLARGRGAEITFVCVRSPLDPIVEDERAPVPHHLATAEDEPALVEAARLADERHVTHREELLIGIPEDEICALADSTDADLIVLGSRGLGAIKGTLLGSVSRGVLSRTSRPVAVVKSSSDAGG
jgi:nucleotide-binding universal stress UspA family protein